MAASAFFDDVLVLVELTELSARVPAGARQQWALDCAKRAIGDDIPALRGHQAMLRGWWRVAQAQLGQRSSATDAGAQDPEAMRQLFEAARSNVLELLDELQRRVVAMGPGGGRARAVAAVESLISAMRCVDGHPDHEATARIAQAAFEDPREEANNQARRLLVRCKLIPSGAELLVRLDYAEDRGALPHAPEQREWLERQRELLMNEDEEGRHAVVFRHLDSLFFGELERAR